MQEIERKFLVDIQFIRHLNLSLGVKLKQGYISDDIERTVRVRKSDTFAWLTIKGKSSDNGMSRVEVENLISHEDADELFKLCIHDIIEKTRFKFRNGNHVFEVDIYHGKNTGLITAEVELKSEDEEVDLPDWIIEEVTGIKKYYNLQIAKNPYPNW